MLMKNGMQRLEIERLSKKIKVEAWNKISKRLNI
jgi:hypothetical protein